MTKKCLDVTINEAAVLLKNADHILILCHGKPDGDTLGSALAMLRALLALGKQVRVDCSDGFSDRYDFMYKDVVVGHTDEFTPEFVLAVDLADPQLLGEKTMCWADRIDLCVDHHPSNSRYARNLLLSSTSAATTELVFMLIKALGVTITPEIGICLYTGLITDTGCFRYSNTSAQTLRTAADLVDIGIDSYSVNKRMFETRSIARITLERIVLETLEFHCQNKLALLVISRRALEETGVEEEETDGISSIPRQIAGVELGITLKEQKDDGYRISVRTGFCCDASQFCKRFGGGGHARAAGCTIEGSLDDVKKKLLEAGCSILS